MTLPHILTRGHAPGDLLDGRGRLFASIHPGQGNLAALAEAVELRWNAHLALSVRCDRLERELKEERAAHRRTTEAADAALDAQRILRQITGAGR